MKADVLLVDGNSLFIRAGFGFMAKPNPEEANDAPASYVFLKALRSAIVDLEVKKAVLCFDTSSKFRKSYYKAYKGDRKKKQNPNYEGIMKQLDEFQEIAQSLNCHYVRLDGYEADDSLYVLSKVFSNQKTVVMTSDLDLVQCVSENVIWWDSKYQRVVELVDGVYRGREAYTTAEVEFKNQDPNGLTPEQFNLIKAISAGDDNIKGIPRYGFKTAKKVVLGEHNKITLAELYDKGFDRSKIDPTYKEMVEVKALLEEQEELDPDELENLKALEKSLSRINPMAKGTEIIDRNRKLMEIDKHPDFKDLILKVQGAMKAKNYDPQKVFQYLGRTQMSSLLVNFQDFIKAFTNLK